MTQGTLTSHAVIEGLKRPFRGKDLEWRIQRAGISKKTGEPYAIVVPYVTARAIFDRLDEVVGGGNWETDLRPTGPLGKTGGMLGGIGVRYETGGPLVWKWDAAPATDIESVKGAASGAIKRAAVQHGMGRDLYGVGDLYAKIHEHGTHYTSTEVKDPKNPQAKVRITFNWDAPELAVAAPARATPARPAPEVAAATGRSEPPTAAQVEFFRKLLKSHVVTDAERQLAEVFLAERVTKTNIGEQIDRLQAAIKDRKEKEKAS